MRRSRRPVTSRCTNCARYSAGGWRSRVAWAARGRHSAAHRRQAQGLEVGHQVAQQRGLGDSDRRLDGRGGIGFQQPQHPDPLLIRLARLLPESGPDLLPHRRQRPVLQGRRLGDGAVLAFQHRQHVERIEHRRPGAKRSDVSGDDLGAGGNRHTVVIQLHPHRPVGVAGRNRVGHPVRPDVPELVDHPRLDAAGLGEVNGQGPQVPPLQRPRLPHRAPVGEPAGRQVRLQLSDDQRVERGPARDCRPRPEHEIAHILDARLDRALLPALRRRTERRRKRIRAPERLKRIGLHPVPAGQHLLDRDRRVVQDYPVRHAAHIGKRRLDPIQQRLESLDGIRLREIHVGVGQGRHHILDLPQHTGDLGPRFPEVDFQRHPRPRATVHVHFLRRRRGLQPRHIPAHRALGNRSRQRQQQPADALGRQSTILPQPLLDLRTPPIQTPLVAPAPSPAPPPGAPS